MIRARKEPPYRFRPVPSVTPRNVRVWFAGRWMSAPEVRAFSEWTVVENAPSYDHDNAKERRLP